MDVKKENMYIKQTEVRKERGKKYIHLAILSTHSTDPPLSLDLRGESADKCASIFLFFFNHTMFQMQF